MYKVYFDCTVEIFLFQEPTAKGVLDDKPSFHSDVEPVSTLEQPQMIDHKPATNAQGK